MPSANFDADFAAIERIFTQRDLKQQEEAATLKKAAGAEDSVLSRRASQSRQERPLERTPKADNFRRTAPKHTKKYQPKHTKQAPAKVNVPPRGGVWIPILAAVTSFLVATGVSFEPAPQNPPPIDPQTGIVEPYEPEKKEDELPFEIEEGNVPKAPSSGDEDDVEVVEGQEVEQAPRMDKAQIEKVNEILSQHPEAKRAFDEIELALTRSSKELGRNMVDVLKEKSEEFSSEVPVELLTCILETESRGFMTNWATGKTITSSAGARGYFQITDICEEDVNIRLAKDGKTRNKDNKNDNIEIGIITLANLWRSFDGDIPKVLTGYNAGASTVLKGYIMDDYVYECVDNHYDRLNEFPEVWEYIMNRDYSNPEEDGIYHVALQENGEADYDFSQLNYDPYA